jgi:hypothetical protein
MSEKKDLPAIVLWKNEQEYSDGARGKACAGMKRQCQERKQPVLAEVRSRVIALLQVLCNECQIE